MRMLNLKLATWVLATLLAFSPPASASSTTPLPPVRLAGGQAGADTPDSDSNFDNIEVLDPALKGRLMITRVGSEPSPNNLLTVFAGLKNKTDRLLRLEVQTIYKDSVGNPLNAGSWIGFTLKPHEEKEYRSSSISEQFNPNAMNAPFFIRVRRAVAAH